MKLSLLRKEFSYKVTASLTALFFIFGGTAIHSSFAGVNELTLNGAQQPVPTLTLEQANGQATDTQNTIPSGATITESGPLSLPASHDVQSSETTDGGRTVSTFGQWYASFLQSLFGSGFTVTARAQSDGSDLVTSTNNDGVATTGPETMSLRVTSDGTIDPGSLQVSFHSPQGVVSVDGALLYAAIGKVIFTGHVIPVETAPYPSFSILSSMNHALGNSVDANGTIHFTLSNVNYNARRDSAGRPILTQETSSAEAQQYEAQLQSELGTGFVVGAWLQPDGSDYVSIVTSTPDAPPTGLYSIVLTVSANGTMDPKSIQTVAYYDTQDAPHWTRIVDGQLLYAGLSQIIVPATSHSILTAMSRAVVNSVDATGRIHFSLGNDYYGVYRDESGNGVIVPEASPVAWTQAPSNANFSFRVTQDASGYRLELRYNPGGGITVLCSGTGVVPDTFDVTPDGSKVIFEGGGNAYVQRVGEPWTAVTVSGDLKQILYYNDYVMLKTDRTYPSGTVIRTSTGIRIGTFNPEFISTFYVTLVTPGIGFYRNDSLSLAVQPEYDLQSGQYYALIYHLYGGNDYSSSISSVSLGQEAPGTAGGTFTLVDAVAAPGGQTVLAIGIDSPTFNKTFLVNQNITFDGAATSVTYENNVAAYTVRDNDGTIRKVHFDLDKLEVVPELPAIEFVQPVILQTPAAANQWTLKLDQAMRGVRYEVQYDAGSGNWQTAGTFIAGSYGEGSWQDPAQDRGVVTYRVVPKEITTASDLLTQINMLYFEDDFGLTEPTHEYPREAWLQRRITQPSNFGFYANLLATIAAGDLVTATISKAEAIRRLDVMMTHLLEDQQTLGYKGLLPWLGFYNGDWQRMDDPYGRQVSFEDNTNMSAGLAVAYGALLDASLSGNATVGGIRAKIDTFLANQREGYVAMYNASNQTFARTMVIWDGHLEGTVDLFGAESMGPLLFLILQYGDAFPASVYQKLYFSTSDYAMQNGTTRTVVEPFSGAFQMYWPALVLPEASEPDLRAMLETYTDVQLDYASRNNQPGILSASYDINPYDLLSSSLAAFSWKGDAVNTSRGSDNSFHLMAGSANGIGVAFTDGSNKFVLEGSTLQIRYASQTAVPNARLEFKQMIDGVLTTVYVQDLALENTGGEVRTLSLQLPEEGLLGDLKEVVFAVSDGSGPLDLTFYNISMDRIQYNFSLGINEIAMNGVSETTPSTYNLGAAYMFRPAGVEALLQKLIADHPELITDHGLWEGLNMTTGKVVKEQVFNNVLSLTLGMAGTGGASMTRYLENKGLTAKLQSIWDPQSPASLTGGTSGNFEWNGFKGTAWHVTSAARASERELHITYQSSTSITGVKLDLKHANSNEPAFSVQLDLPATGSTAGEYVITIPDSYLYWYITDAVVLFPESQGYPNAKITGMTLVPIGADVTPPVVVLDAGTPHLINTKSLTVSYTSDGLAKTKVFTGLSEGDNTLTITETDASGNQAVAHWTVTVDTIAPVVVLDSGTPHLIHATSLTINYTADGVAKQKDFTGLAEGLNALAITEADLAGNQTTVNCNVTVDTSVRPYLDISGTRAVSYAMTSNSHTGVFSNAGPDLRLGWQSSYIENRGFVQFNLSDFYSSGISVSQIAKIEFVADYISGSGSIALYDMKTGETGSHSLYSIYFYLTSTLIRDIPATEYPKGLQIDVTSAVLADITAGKGWSGLMLRAPSYQGYPDVIFSPDAHLRIYLNTPPASDVVPSEGGVETGMPGPINTESFTVSDTSGGVAETKLLEASAENSNTLMVTETAAAGSFDEIAPQIVSLTSSAMPVFNLEKPLALSGADLWASQTRDRPGKLELEKEDSSVMPKFAILQASANGGGDRSRRASSMTRKKSASKDRLSFRLEIPKQKQISDQTQESLLLTDVLGGRSVGTMYCLLDADRITGRD